MLFCVLKCSKDAQRSLLTKKPFLISKAAKRRMPGPCIEQH